MKQHNWLKIFRKQRRKTIATQSPDKLDNGDFPKGMSQPALRALNGAGIKSLEDLSRFSEMEIAKLHGMGQTGLVKLKAALAERGLSYGEKKVDK